jgi:RalA-binding protein 1
MATTKSERRRTVMNTTTFDPSLLEQPPAPPVASTNANPPMQPNTSKPSSRSSTQTQRQVSGGPSHSQKTLDQILANASPPGDMQNALSQLLDERNAVVQQNTQLWRIIEKQKASLASAAKDLERIRAEREKYRRLFEETSGSGSEGRSRTGSKNRLPMARHQSDDVGECCLAYFRICPNWIPLQNCLGGISSSRPFPFSWVSLRSQRPR